MRISSSDDDKTCMKLFCEAHKILSPSPFKNFETYSQQHSSGRSSSYCISCTEKGFPYQNYNGNNKFDSKFSENNFENIQEPSKKYFQSNSKNCSNYKLSTEETPLTRYTFNSHTFKNLINVDNRCYECITKSALKKLYKLAYKIDEEIIKLKEQRAILLTKKQENCPNQAREVDDDSILTHNTDNEAISKNYHKKLDLNISINPLRTFCRNNNDENRSTFIKKDNINLQTPIRNCSPGSNFTSVTTSKEHTLNYPKSASNIDVKPAQNYSTLKQNSALDFAKPLQDFQISGQSTMNSYNNCLNSVGLPHNYCENQESLNLPFNCENNQQNCYQSSWQNTQKVQVENSARVFPKPACQIYNNACAHDPPAHIATIPGHPWCCHCNNNCFQKLQNDRECSVYNRRLTHSRKDEMYQTRKEKSPTRTNSRHLSKKSSKPSLFEMAKGTIKKNRTPRELSSSSRGCDENKKAQKMVYNGVRIHRKSDLSDKYQKYKVRNKKKLTEINQRKKDSNADITIDSDDYSEYPEETRKAVRKLQLTPYKSVKPNPASDKSQQQIERQKRLELPSSTTGNSELRSIESPHQIVDNIEREQEDFLQYLESDLKAHQKKEKCKCRVPIYCSKSFKGQKYPSSSTIEDSIGATLKKLVPQRGHINLINRPASDKYQYNHSKRRMENSKNIPIDYMKQGVSCIDRTSPSYSNEAKTESTAISGIPCNVNHSPNKFPLLATPLHLHGIPSKRTSQPVMNKKQINAQLNCNCDNDNSLEEIHAGKLNNADQNTFQEHGKIGKLQEKAVCKHTHVSSHRDSSNTKLPQPCYNSKSNVHELDHLKRDVQQIGENNCKSDIIYTECECDKKIRVLCPSRLNLNESESTNEMEKMNTPQLPWLNQSSMETQKTSSTNQSPVQSENEPCRTPNSQLNYTDDGEVESFQSNIQSTIKKNEETEAIKNVDRLGMRLTNDSNSNRLIRSTSKIHYAHRSQISINCACRTDSNDLDSTQNYDYSAQTINCRVMQSELQRDDPFQGIGTVKPDFAQFSKSNNNHQSTTQIDKEARPSFQRIQNHTIEDRLRLSVTRATSPNSFRPNYDLVEGQNMPPQTEHYVASNIERECISIDRKSSFVTQKFPENVPAVQTQSVNVPEKEVQRQPIRPVGLEVLTGKSVNTPDSSQIMRPISARKIIVEQRKIETPLYNQRELLKSNAATQTDCISKNISVAAAVQVPETFLVSTSPKSNAKHYVQFYCPINEDEMQHLGAVNRNLDQNQQPVNLEESRRFHQIPFEYESAPIESDYLKNECKSAKDDDKLGYVHETQYSNMSRTFSDTVMCSENVDYNYLSFTESDRSFRKKNNTSLKRHEEKQVFSQGTPQQQLLKKTLTTTGAAIGNSSNQNRYQRHSTNENSLLQLHTENISCEECNQSTSTRLSDQNVSTSDQSDNQNPEYFIREFRFKSVNDDSQNKHRSNYKKTKEQGCAHWRTSQAKYASHQQNHTYKKQNANLFSRTDSQNRDFDKKGMEDESKQQHCRQHFLHRISEPNSNPIHDEPPSFESEHRDENVEWHYHQPYGVPKNTFRQQMDTHPQSQYTSLNFAIPPFLGCPCMYPTYLNIVALIPNNDLVKMRRDLDD